MTDLEQQTLSPFVDGTFADGDGEKTLVSAATAKPWKKLQETTPELMAVALESAKEAFVLWKKTPAPKRAEILRKLATLITENKIAFATTMSHEMGKPFKEGLAEVDYGAGYFDWFAGEAERIFGMQIPSQYPGKRIFVMKEPIGVAAAITPWNFPLALPARKIAASLAAGCPILIKPSAQACVTPLLLAALSVDAGLPPGVLQVLPGAHDVVGDSLLHSPIIRKLSFTGSTEVGKDLYRRSAETLKKLTLELGGHAPLLVFDDADLETSVKGTIEAKFRNTGQTCVAASRVFVQEKIYDQFVRRLVEAIKNLKQGNPLDPETQISQSLHPTTEKKLQIHLKDALSKGATLLLEYPPIVEGITSDMLLMKEETFAPLVAIGKFETVEEGIALANQTDYGLAAYVFCQNLQTAFQAMEGLESGIVGVNDGLPSTPQAPFGGVKYSGFGKEGGPTGIDEFLVDKYISLKIF